MPFDVTDFNDLMALESHGPDVFVGIGPSYPWGRVYGGQVVAQALRAACHTIDSDHRVHSLHAYFIRGGDFDEPIRYEVDRIRNGRSFLTRRVVARQSVGPILNLSASFQLDEPEQQNVPGRRGPAGPEPEALPASDWGPILARRSLPVELDPARAAAWLKVAQSVGEDPILQACALAYASDDMPTEAATLSHPRRLEDGFEQAGHDAIVVGASLDHSIWFHRPGRHDDWVLHDFYGQGVVGGRGLALGQLYDRSGVHLATVSQEVLLRERTR